METKILLQDIFNADDIDIVVNKTSNRKIDPEIESKIDEIWEETVRNAKEQGQLIYNGESFRLDSFKESNGQLKLVLSKIKYKDRSSLNKLANELIEKGEDYLPNTLAIGGFIKTTDNKFVFGKRSGRTITNNKEDFIGGILEPEKLNTGEDLFDYNLQEIKEEINLDKADIEHIRLVALVRTPWANIILLTYTTLKLTSNEVAAKFHAKDKKDFEEMADLIFVDKSKLSEKLMELGGYKLSLLNLVNTL